MSAQLSVILVTTSRADWGILSTLAHELQQRKGVDLRVAVGNMHLHAEYGMTVNEITSQGFDVVRLDAPMCEAGAASRTVIAAATMTSLAREIERHRPDAVILLGDRYEILGAASAALIADVPIVHLHGGEVSHGAIDDAVRHAVSKMASLHLPATEAAARRLAAMGEDPERIIRTGAIGVENVLSISRMSLTELRDELDGFDVNPERTFIVTFHPVTRADAGPDSAAQTEALLGALSDVPQANILLTHPNNDTGSDEVTERLTAFAAANIDRVKFVKSLGVRRYITALYNSCAVVGNSSSGIIEAPSSPAWTIDIGPRQDGRDRAASIIHVDADRAAIAAAIRDVLQRPRRQPRADDNPYYRKNAAATAADAIVDLLPRLPHIKKMYNDK